MADEQNKARRWWPWRFSLRTLLTVMLTVAVWLGYRDIQIRRNANREFVRALLNTELGGLHRSLSVGTPYNAKLQVLQMSPGVVHVKPTPGLQLDVFQTQSLNRISNGEDEVWRINPWSGDVRYVGKLKMSKSCTDCHAVQGDVVLSLDVK